MSEVKEFKDLTPKGKAAYLITRVILTPIALTAMIPMIARSLALKATMRKALEGGMS